MKKKILHHPVTITLGSVLLFLSISSSLLLTNCFSRKSATTGFQTKSGLDAVKTVDMLSRVSVPSRKRSAALLGVYIASYVSKVVTLPVQSALRGIEAQAAFASALPQATNTDEALLQAFAIPMSVDVADMLNRSVNRQQALEAYVTALNNVATRANNRFKELKAETDSLQKTVNEQKTEKSALESAIKKAIDSKDFTLASEKQSILTKQEKNFSESEPKLKQEQQLLRTYDKLLAAYGDRILAIQKNREALIAGTRVINVPGVKDLKLLEEGKGAKRQSGPGGGGGGLFNFSNAFNGL